MSDTNNHRPRQFNFNTLVGIVAVGLVSLVIGKLDHMNTTTIQLDTSVRLLSEHVKDLDVKVDGMVTKGQMEAELQRRDTELQELKKEIDAVKRRIPASHVIPP